MKPANEREVDPVTEMPMKRRCLVFHKDLKNCVSLSYDLEMGKRRKMASCISPFDLSNDPKKRRREDADAWFDFSTLPMLA
jgi:hypothetical protein